MEKVLVGMSGGVDSAVTAYLMKLAGYEVIGITLKTWLNEDGTDSRCCEIDDARAAAIALDIPYYVRSCTEEFDERVVRPFIDEYISGRTPNPCVGCNRNIKWKKMLEAANDMNARYIATGHYATVLELENGRYSVKKATHEAKDQTYMLYRLTQEQLSRTIMPLGRLSKDEVRDIARKAHIPVAEKPDSQEICFVKDDDYAAFIEEHAQRELPPEGDFVDPDGRILGKHSGIHHYTIGQRKGLGIALGYPAFVRKISPDDNTVTLDTNESLFSDEIIINDINYMGIPPLEQGESIRADVKIRYQHKPAPAAIERVMSSDDASLLVRFDEPVRAATPGQAVVAYDENGCVLCGGTILHTSGGRDNEKI
ncbi:MAG: tRNA 2-thiouridine(34) synthase MnmA [Eubacterium sp.]|nr:tRNA 2-thiouridine(34) synthase MnmA [Eubacterium sp.]